jgi:PleD family two-component response regulator
LIAAMDTPPRQRRATQLLDARARRTELLDAILRARGLSPARVLRILCLELAEMEREAEREADDALASLSRALRNIIADVGAIQQREETCHDILLLDGDEVSRDLVALAILAQGHRVRTAATLAELVTLFAERRPDAVLADSNVPDASEDRLCAVLRDTILPHEIPILVFAGAAGTALATLALNAGATRFVSKDQGIGELMSELDAVLTEILR